MICKNCKKVIVDDACYCSYCGKKVLAKAVGAGSEVREMVPAASMTAYYQIVSAYFQELCPAGIDASKYFNPEYKKTMRDIFYQYCLNLQDYNMMPSVIKFENEERQITFRKILYDYDPSKVLEHYTEESLYDIFCTVFPVKNRESKGNSWRKYARSIIDTCVYLKQFDNAEAFNAYVEGFQGDIEVVKHMASSIRGMGFALACNMVKDLGFTEYAKPDTHTKDVLEAMGYQKEDLAVLRAIQKIAAANNDSAFNFDRMIWLICSGNYFLDGYRMASHKNELISKIRNV